MTDMVRARAGAVAGAVVLALVLSACGAEESVELPYIPPDFTFPEGMVVDPGNGYGADPEGYEGQVPSAVLTQYGDSPLEAAEAVVHAIITGDTGVMGYMTPRAAVTARSGTRSGDALDMLLWLLREDGTREDALVLGHGSNFSEWEFEQTAVSRDSFLDPVIIAVTVDGDRFYVRTVEMVEGWWQVDGFSSRPPT